MKRLLLIYALALTGASVFLFLLAAGLSYDLRVCGVIIMLLAFLVSIPLINHLIARTFESVNMLDLSRPVFDELSTLIFQIRRQSEFISNQLSDMQKTQIEFAAITNHMREGLLLLDKEARVLSYNQSALTLLRARRKNFEAHPSVLTFRRDEPFRAAVERALQGAPSEIILPSEGRSLQMIANPITDNGETRGAILFFLDVTDREDRDKLRREFSANVSHELKTPLMAISGYAEIMARGVAKPGDMPSFAEKIYNEAQRLILLVDDIMMLSRLDEKDPALNENIEINSLIQNILERVEPAASSRGVHVDFEKGAEEITLKGNRRILDEIVYNLLDNAVKYNYNGGKVSVKTEVSGDGVSVCVADTGIGIPLSEQERVFERFYRVDKSRGLSTPGTGLGLSIVKHGAALHSASIKLRSDGRSGTCVEVIFPPPNAAH